MVVSHGLGARTKKGANTLIDIATLLGEFSSVNEAFLGLEKLGQKGAALAVARVYRKKRALPRAHLEAPVPFITAIWLSGKLNTHRPQVFHRMVREFWYMFP